MHNYSSANSFQSTVIVVNCAFMFSSQKVPKGVNPSVIIPYCCSEACIWKNEYEKPLKHAQMLPCCLASLCRCMYCSYDQGRSCTNKFSKRFFLFNFFYIKLLLLLQCFRNSIAILTPTFLLLFKIKIGEYEENKKRLRVRDEVPCLNVVSSCAFIGNARDIARSVLTSIQLSLEKRDTIDKC